MSKEKPHRTGLLGRILSGEDAIKTIKQASYVIIVMAFIYAVVGFITDPALITDAFFYIILGGLTFEVKKQSCINYHINFFFISPAAIHFE